jgi:hypothetical protein
MAAENGLQCGIGYELPEKIHYPDGLLSKHYQEYTD